MWIERPKFLLFSIYWATFIMSIFVFLNPKAFTVVNRLEGTLGNANMYGLALLMSIIYALNQIFYGRHVFKIIYLVSVPPLLYLLGETGSRKGIISVILFMGIYAFLKTKINIRKKPFIALITVIVFVAVGLFSLNYLRTTKHYHRLEEFLTSIVSDKIERADESTRNRLLLYRVGLKAASEHPVLGVGLDNFRYEMQGNYNRQIGTYAHSNYIELLADTGFIGFALYYAIYVLLLISIIKLRPSKVNDNQMDLYLLSVSLFIIYVLYDFAMVSYFEKFSWLILTFIITATQTLRYNKPNKIPVASDTLIRIT